VTATPLSSTDLLVGDPRYPQLKEQVLAATGLNYYQDKDSGLAQRLGRRLAALGIRDCTSYLELLRDPLRGAAELDELIAEITIGETYFFRHSDHFDALRDIVLPDVIARNQATQTLRVWCAGCADGPEPYSVAILLRRELGHKLAGWTVNIVGTDINRRCLARAREGRFEEWAFRATPEDVKRECFTKTGKQWIIAPRYREIVTFQPHNLAEHHFPSLIHNLASFDLIICRNVMIYFAPELMRRIIGQFYDSLVPGAWLLVGPTEPNMSSYGAFRTVNAPGVTLYQKRMEAARPEIITIPSLPEAPSPIQAPPVCPSALQELPPTLDDVRACADRGDWEEARRLCEELLKSDGLNAVAHFYYALILEQTGRHQETERALRHAIYLDRRAALPPYYLGLFLQAQGDPRAAVKSFENVLELLNSHQDSESFPDADGITVAELKALAKMHIEVIGQGRRGSS
jgi:chemotaxis protein methyltransferase CheR